MVVIIKFMVDLEHKTPLQERKNRYNAPGSIRSVSRKYDIVDRR
jgi:hypothetical protein